MTPAVLGQRMADCHGASAHGAAAGLTRRLPTRDCGKIFP
jgi:hypothetical protein